MDKLTSETRQSTATALADLKKQRSQINAAIYKLEQTLQPDSRKKKNPEAKANGPVYYLHNKFVAGKPRITVAGYVNLSTNELHWSLYICPASKQFSKRKGRMRAMGKAVSTRRHIVKLKDLAHAAVRDRLYKSLLAVQADINTAEQVKAERQRTIAVSKVVEGKFNIIAASNGSY